MYLKYLVRSHFEVNGEYRGFPYSEELEEYASKVGMSEEDAYYHLVGYSSDNHLTPTERFKYRKLSSEGNTKELSNIFKLKDKTDLIEVLEKMNCLSARGMVRPVKSKDKMLNLMARLLAEYLLKNEEKVVWAGKEPKFYSEIVQPMKYVKSKKELDNIVGSERFLKALDILMPDVVYKKGCVPLITQGIFFVPFKLSESQLRELVMDAVYHSVIRNLDIPPQVYFNLVPEALTYQRKDDSSYLRLVDWSHSLGMTIKEMIEKCGITYIDRLEYYRKYKVVPYMVGENKVLVYSKQSKTEDQYVILSSNQVMQLINSDSLKTLYWEEKVPHIYLNGKQDLRLIFGVERLTNFSVGGI